MSKNSMTKYLSVFIFIFLITLLSYRLSASPQMPDYFIFKGDTISTYNLILEQYLQKIGEAEQGKLFGLSFRSGASTNCWRGYQAIYKIDNDTLFLVHIVYCGERRSGKIDEAASDDKMNKIFKDKVINGKVYIDWFSGDISFPLKSPINKVLRWDGVFYTIFEQETIISITKGKVLNIAEINNYEDNPNAIDRKDKSKLSDILFKQLKKVKWKSKFYCSEKYLVTIGENGKVSKVIMPEYPTQDSIDKYWDRDEYNYCINNVFNALQKLKFDIIKDKGKPISENVYVEIFFDSRRKIENWTR